MAQVTSPDLVGTAQRRRTPPPRTAAPAQESKVQAPSRCRDSTPQPETARPRRARTAARARPGPPPRKSPPAESAAPSVPLPAPRRRASAPTPRPVLTTPLAQVFPAPARGQHSAKMPCLPLVAAEGADAHRPRLAATAEAG